MITKASIESGLLEEEHLNAWSKPIVCRVEVDLTGWMMQLTGHDDWEILGEEENEHCLSYAMRLGRKEAEVTLYHSGYAVVDVDGQALFDGTLTNGKNDWAQLSYFNAEDGQPITFN
jgi:hypothetical protein